MQNGVKPTQKQIDSLRKERRDRKRDQMNKIKFPIVNASWKDLFPFIISFILAVVLTSFMSCSSALTTIGFDENKQYFSPKSIMIHDGQQNAVTFMGPFKLDEFLEVKEAYKDCKWLVTKNQVHIYCKSILTPTKYEHKPHTFKNRGFGNTNHNAPGHVCDETCHL